MRHGAPYQRQRFIDIERLGQVFEGTALIGGHGAVEVGMRRHHDDGQVRVFLAHARHQVETIGSGHADIGDQDIRALTHDAGFGLIGTLEGFHLEVGLCQSALQHPANGTVVIDDTDAGSLAHV